MSNPRILIAEDEWIFAEDIRRTLEGFGFEISSIASTGEKSIQKAHEDQPNLVLMDIVLGGEIDGIEAAQQIREKLNIPVVFLTAHADERTLTRAKITEPYAYVVKPFADRELRAAVEMALSRYKMETRLRESEQFSSSLLTYAPNPIIVINPDTSIRYVNPALERATGYSSSELIGVKPPYPWWTRENLKGTEKDLRNAMNNGAQSLVELCKNKNGERFWVEITSQPIMENGQFKYYLGNWIDITERKRIAEKEKQYMSKVEFLSRTAMEFVKFPSVESIYKLIGLRLKELLGDGFYVIVNSFDEGARCICVEAISGFSTHMEKILGILGKNPTNSRFPISDVALEGLTRGELTELYGGMCELTFGRIPKSACKALEKLLNVGKIYVVGFTREGKLFGTAVIIASKGRKLSNREVVETYMNQASMALQRKQIADILKESEERYRELFEKSTDFMYTLDLNGTFTSVNRAAEHHTGYTKDELIGMNFRDYVSKDEQERFFRAFNRVYKTGEALRDFSFEVTIKDGAKKYFETSATPLRKGKEIEGFQGNSRDITQRKQAEEALRESEAQKKAILDASIDRILLSDTKMMTIWANQTHTRDLNIATEDIVGKACYEVFVGRHTPCPGCPAKKAVKSGKTEHSILVRSPQGSKGEKNYLDAHAVPIKDESGNVITILHITRDITAQVLAEERLRESEANYRELADSITDVFFAMDKNLRYTYWNKASEKLTGIAAKDAIGKSIDFLFTNMPGKRKAEEAYREVLRTQQPKNFVNEFSLRGDHYFFDISAYPSRDGLSVFVKDITGRKHTEEALRESEEKYRLLVEYANDAIFIAQDEVVKFPNPRAEEMVGYSAGELAKIPFAELVHPEDRDTVLERYRRKLQGEELPSTYSFRIFNKQGEELWVQLNPVLISWEERPATLNFLRDITQQKRLEAQLIQAQKMEAIGTLAGGIAHDFNNLLMGILGFTSLMLMNIGPPHPHYERLQGIEGLVLSGAELTRQLLGFAQGGKYEVKPLDLNEVVKKTSGMFSRTKKEITIHRKYQRDIWPIEADGGQIEQVLLNLYVNAWQAMPGGGELYLTTENLILDADQITPFSVKPGRFVRITVTDTGTGMDEETKHRIFEPFFTTKERGRGTGLGLASAYGIIKNHGGYIEVESRENEGTTFSISLPASERTLMEEKQVPKDIVMGTEKVLLVDDEDIVIEIAKEMLASLGYDVLIARGGREALEIYEKERDTIDLVILDMIMPKMGGGEVYDQLKQINPGLKVLLSSGYSIDGQAGEILQRGCNGFIQKPFDMRRLSRKIREILDEK
jgi:two-component system cell cycle sensor histidine kinase/response regulator CckA